MNDSKQVKPADKPKPPPKSRVKSKAPKASLPPRAGSMFGRPMAASPSQRHKRNAARGADSITAKVTDGEGELMLFGTIGEDFWGEGVSDKSFNESLKQLGDVKTIRLRINSGGGDVFHATAIYNMLVKHEANVIVEIEGVAASAATLIAMAADEIRISENAHFMIHAASGIAWGNAEELRQYLKLLDNADELIRLTYSARTGIDPAELVGMMDHDNWMTAQEALDLGFADALDSAKSVKPHVDPDEADNAVTKRPAAISPERLAAMASNLLSLSASVRHPTITGGGPKPVPEKESTMKMNVKLRAKCLAAGMPESLTGEEAEKWFDDNADAALAVADKKQDDKKPVDPTANIIDILEAREKAKADKRKAWRKEVGANVALAFGDNPPANLLEACYDLEEEGLDAVRVKIQAARKESDDKTQTGGVRITFSDKQPRDKHLAAIGAGLKVRCLQNFVPIKDIKLSQAEILEKHMPAKDRPAGWEDFSKMHLLKLAEECLLADGFSYDQLRRLSGPQIGMAALGFHRQAGIRAAGALHTTGSLAEITRDAINKSLVAGYEEAPQTWRGPGRQGTSVSDFKDIHRVRLGGAANLPIWPDNTAPEEAKLANEKERYAVEARAEKLSFSWRLIINDDMDALSRRPQILGDAAGRTVNAVFWQQITSNPTMADGQALFLASPTGLRFRSNLTTGSATPTNATIGAMKAKMRLMRGLNTPEGAESADILNLTPTFIVGPASLEELILKQVFSGADPADNKSSATFNTSRTLTPIIEPLLDAATNGTTAWYLFASPSRVDTVEVTFLQGQETPIAHEWMDDETMCQNYTIIQTFGCKALDHRGVQKHDGA